MTRARENIPALLVLMWAKEKTLFDGEAIFDTGAGQEYVQKNRQEPGAEIEMYSIQLMRRPLP